MRRVGTSAITPHWRKTEIDSWAADVAALAATIAPKGEEPARRRGAKSRPPGSRLSTFALHFESVERQSGERKLATRSKVQIGLQITGIVPNSDVAAVQSACEALVTAAHSASLELRGSKLAVTAVD